MTEELKKETNKILFLMATSELAHSFLYVTYTIFLISRGVSLYQIAMLCMICSIAMVVLDIPTGAFADVFGRKRTYMLSCLIWIAATIVYIASTNFWGYAVAETLAALAMSFANGCVSAHMWDTVSALGIEQGLAEGEIEQNNKMLSAKSIWVTSPVSAIGGFIGVKLFAVNSAIPWMGTGIGMIFVFILASRVLHETRVKKVEYARDVKEMTKNTILAFRILAREKGLQNIAVTRTLVRVVTVPIFLYWTAYLKEVGGSVIVLGYAWILMEVAMSLGVYLCRRVPERVSPQRIIQVCVLLTGLSAIAGAVTKSFIPVLVAILVIEAATMALGYVFGNITQKEITDLGYGEAGGENNMRATLLSSVSTSITVGGMLGEYSFGSVATRYGISTSWLISGLFITTIAVVTYLLLTKASRDRALQAERAAA